MSRFIKKVQAVSKNSAFAGDDTEIDKLKHHVIEEMKKLEHLQLSDAATPWTEKFGLVLTQFMFKIDTLEERFNTSLSLVEDHIFKEKFTTNLHSQLEENQDLMKQCESLKKQVADLQKHISVSER